MILWLTGMSGVGKTTLAEAVLQLVRAEMPTGVLAVDGDAVRTIWGDDLGYSEEERLKNMTRMAQLSRYLDGQRCHVVASLVAPYRETREWMRQHVPSYYEVFITSPLEQLAKRDPKGLYRQALAGETGLPGVNQRYETPESPDMTIDNTGNLDALLAYARPLSDLVLRNDRIHSL
ncbi:adenylyl-sulfate kinase [Desulfovibrio sp. OttesenSCG-928-I05]|nr:adenylyl-sulfate kinase [Desulfovibrio sp. OttesenSCG-928-I05]